MAFLNEVLNLSTLIDTKYEYIIGGSTALFLLVSKYIPEFTENIPVPKSIDFLVDKEYDLSNKGLRLIYEKNFEDYSKIQTSPERISSFQNPNENLSFNLVMKPIKKTHYIVVNGLKVLKPEFLINDFDHDPLNTTSINYKNEFCRGLLLMIQQQI